ncbi:serine hydrolase [Actinosynnema pretiosum]|uniref:Serine hydrolase n=1 Tax=Actinosynnema pretiosum TaxID=42197 RepID=A0A290Z026_9PSEU|nr:serine hydrolase [Actinosynnema pretiosum]
MLPHLLLSATLALSPTPSTVDVPTVGSTIQDFLSHREVPGLAVAVTHDGRTLHAEGRGHLGDGTPVTATTPMPVASLSKSMTALVVVQLAERGRIDLGAPVRDQLPEFTTADPRSAGITPRHLLQHTSGLTDRTNPTDPATRTPRDAVAAMRASTLASAPGTEWSYHNPNHQLAARLVEHVTGEPFADHLRTALFEPLGMSDSRAANTPLDLPGHRGHLRLPIGPPVPFPEPMSFGGGSGGVLSSARDLAAWLIAHHRGGPAFTTTTTPATTPPFHAMGWFARRTPSGAPLLTHDGDLATATAYQALLPATGHGVAVAANTATRHADAQALGQALVELLDGGTPEIPADPQFAVDAVLLAATPLPVALAAHRARRPSRRRWTWPLLLTPWPLLLGAHHVTSHLYRGRPVSWLQAATLYPTFLLLLLVTALSSTTLLALRLLRPRATAPSPPHHSGG